MHNLERVYCVWKVFLYLLKTQEAVHLRAFQHYKCISTFFELATTLKNLGAKWLSEKKN